MIASIDQLRATYVAGISQALHAYAGLVQLDSGFAELEHVPSVEAIDEVEHVAARIMTAYVEASRAVDDPGATFHIGGDMIQVGDITDSENIVIGKDMQQEVNHEA